jgi:hypothetical protein
MIVVLLLGLTVGVILALTGAGGASWLFRYWCLERD